METPRINPPILCQRYGYNGLAIRITACPPKPGCDPSEIKLSIVDVFEGEELSIVDVFLDPETTGKLINQLLSPGFPD